MDNLYTTISNGITGGAVYTECHVSKFVVDKRKKKEERLVVMF
jgi:hypothetical protein